MKLGNWLNFGALIWLTLIQCTVAGPAQAQAASLSSTGNQNFDQNNRPARVDKFTDFPQVDEAGIRHFANGRHHDLSIEPVQQALSNLIASDDQILQEERARKKALRQMRRRNNW